MKLSQTFQLAVSSILSNKGRSLLTMLGIIIGVAAVIVIVGLGNGMETYMTESFQDLGTNLLTVTVTGRGSTRSVSVDDMFQLAEDNPEYFSAVSPTVTVNGTVKVGSEELEDTRISGVGEDYAEMKNYTLSQGRFLQYADNLTRSKSCVVGSYVAETWFGGAAKGQTLRINGDVYEIVGVLEESADTTAGSADDMIYIPYSTAAKVMGTGTISSYSYAMVSEENVAESKEIINRYLYNVFGSTDAYNILSMSEILDTMTGMINILVTILTVIAGISLVVGGIGIMNIMLVSVSERTREIGIRKALGAKQNNILQQFVIEAGTTSGIGGIIGIGFGYLISFIATKLIAALLSTTMAVTPSMASITLAFGVSVGIGILFGFLPARKAGRLNPIDALRYD